MYYLSDFNKNSLLKLSETLKTEIAFKKWHVET